MNIEKVNELGIESSLLKRQIRKHLKNFECRDSDKIKNFLNSIDLEYSDIKENRELLERSLDLSSKELLEKNDELKKVIKKNIEINRKLEKSKNKLSIIVDNLGEGLLVINGDKKIILANKKASVISGYLIEELVGEEYDKYIKFFNEKKLNNKKNYILDCLEKKEEYILDQNIILKGRKKEVPVSITFTPLTNYELDGGMACIVVFRDATKDRELANMKNEFLSVASHELRTPMTVIKGYSSILSKGKLGDITERQKEYLERIEHNTGNLIEMVNDMLDINKLEAGKMEFNLAKFNINDVVNSSIKDMLELFSKKNILLEKNTFDYNIISDEKKIKQVIINLLSNSYKFSKNNTKVKLEMKLLESNKIKISIIDEGNGIKKEDLKKLFKKFSQVGNHLNKTEKGTGLGLSLSKKIIEGLGGEIGVRSKYGEGSEFYFILPQKKEEK